MTGWMLATEMHLSHKSIQHHRTQTETMRQHKPQLIEQKLELDCRQPTWSGLLTDSAKKSDDTDAIDAKNALKGYMNIFQALPIDVMLVLDASASSASEQRGYGSLGGGLCWRSL